MKKLIITLFCVFISLHIIGQVTQSIKGQIIDQDSEMPILGATIQVSENIELTGTATDMDGYFEIENVPVGRYSLIISYLGYESLVLPNVNVISGKETFLNINLKERFEQLKEVVISANTEKDKAQNEMATISARQLSLEEVNRYSGGRSDVSRLAANFAGVSSPNDSRNDIVIRGNSPTGVLWRLEGIPMPSPNHFSTAGTTGGPVSALNPNMLRNSDFMTSAFPAEYGNALAGVFDIGFRNGNKDQTEFTLQLGAFSGFEAMVEGPIGHNNGSYVLAGRYSFIGIVGAGSTSAVPNYQDVSFKVDLGQSPIGQFTLFGIGGQSDIDFLASEIEDDDLFAAKDEDSYYDGKFGIIGLKHNLLFGNRSYLRTIVATSYSGNTFDQDRYYNLGTPDELNAKFLMIDQGESRMSISSYCNTKLNSRHSVRAGILIEKSTIDIFMRGRDRQPDLDNDGLADFFTFQDFDGTSTLYQPYIQTAYRINEKLTTNVGVHGQYGDLNEKFVVEPRLSINYDLNEKNRISIGYGIHNQTSPLPILLLNEDLDGETVRANVNLDFTRSQHFVLAHDYKLGKDWRLKTELYYQLLDRVPIDTFSSSYSILSEGADFGFSTDKTSLVNEGTAFNRGVELTLEKFYSSGYYMLATGSFFESKYKGSDGVERNSPFNNGYVVNLLAGREFKIGKEKRNALTFDTKLTTAGGRWYTPIDLESSRNLGYEVKQEEDAFSLQQSSYLRIDVRFGVKLNGKKKNISHQFYFDIQNLTNRDNLFISRYDRLTGEVDDVNQIGLFPDFLYRLQF